MYLQHPEGGKELIYEIEVNTYPEGVVWNYLTSEWEERPVHRLNGNDWWIRPEPDFSYKKERRIEINRQKYDQEYVDPKLQAYRQQEWDRRINGFWFYNKGKATYITGTHYFYLTHWKIDIGYPQYRNADRKFFYLWKWVCDNPNVMGLVEVASRRSGKSWRSGCCLYDRVSYTPEAAGGIQSKSDTDAVKYYNKLFSAFRKLPDFFIPEYNSRSVKSGLFFQKNFKVDEEYDEELELNSRIEYAASNASSFDSDKLHAYVRDEVFKPIEGGKKLDIIDMWLQVRPTMQLGSRKIIGKAIFTSTVEEGVTEQGIRIWDMSDYSKKNELGRTESWMVRIFFPAYENDESYLDKYGFTDEEESKRIQLIERESLKGNSRALLAQKRKYPFTIEEAFYKDPGRTPFDANEINETLSYIHNLEIIDKSPVVVGDFQWVNGIEDSRVEFVKNQNGKFYLNRKIFENLDLFSRATIQKTNGFHPVNEFTIVAGCDPFDHRSHEISDEYRMSNGAAYVFHKYDGLNEELSETFLCEYIFRRPDPNDFYEDMLMMCYFFGCKILYENNKPGLREHFERRGYKTWVITPKGSNTPGIPATTKNKTQLVEVFTSYIANNCKKIPFKRLLEDLLSFDFDRSTKNDATMGAGWALVAAYRADKKLTKDDKKKIVKNQWNYNLLSRL